MLFNNHNYHKFWNNQITELKTSSYLLIFHENHMFFIFFEINMIRDSLILIFLQRIETSISLILKYLKS